MGSEIWVWVLSWVPVEPLTLKAFGAIGRDISSVRWYILQQTRLRNRRSGIKHWLLILIFLFSIKLHLAFLPLCNSALSDTGSDDE